MALFFYNPPELDEDGKPFPPFVYEYSGDAKCVMAHRYWKPIQEQYVIEKHRDKFGDPIIDRETGEQKVTKGWRTAWVLDEEKNREMDEGTRLKPDNGFHLSRGEFRDLQQSRYNKFMKYVVAEDKIRKDHRKNLEELRRAQFVEIENEKRMIEEERAAFMAKMRESLKVTDPIEQFHAEADEMGLPPVKRPVGRPRKTEQ